MRKYWYVVFPLILIIGYGLYTVVGGGESNRSITTEQLAQLLEDNEHDYYYIDVREDHEFSAGHIPGMVNLPLSKLDELYQTLPQDKTVVVICRSGSRSLQAINKLKGYGYEDLINVSGGMLDWKGTVTK